MIRVLGVLAFLIAHPVSAETVVVRSGEHGPFTRVVLDFPSAPRYELEQRNGDFFVKVNRRVSRLDTSRLFEKITTERVRGAQLRSGEIALVLNCACDVRDTRYARSIVLDVYPKQEPPEPLPLVFSENPPRNTESEVGFTLPDGDVDTSALAQNLSEGLARAASQGLVSIDPNAFQPATDRPDQTPSKTSDARPTIDSFNVQTSIDTVLSPSQPRGTDPAERCTEFPEPWPFLNDSQDFNKALGRYRLEWQGDPTDVQNQRNLARMYLSFGLGLEAMQLLASSDQPIDHTLRAVGETLEYGRSGLWLSETLHACSTFAAAVRVIGLPATERTTEVQELRRAFETIARMPKEVQLLLLPMLLSQVQNTKDNDLAAEISVYVQDLQTPSEGRINGIANDPEAIRQKIEAQIDALQPIGDADKTLLASFITQMRGSDKVVPLIKTQTRMYLHGAQLNLALEKIREHGLSQNTYADLISRAVKGATDLEFLTVIDRTKDQSPEFDGDEESQRVIAQRFLDLGFGKAAMSWAETLPSSAVNDILKAQIYLALNQPRAARDVLVGHNVAKAKELRLQADLLAGDRVQAMQSAALIEDEKAVQKALTRMGAWDDLSLLPAEAPLVRVQQSTTQVQDLADKRSLTDSQKLLEASRIAREGIGQILSTEPELNLTNN